MWPKIMLSTIVYKTFSHIEYSFLMHFILGLIWNANMSVDRDAKLDSSKANKLCWKMKELD